MLHLYCLGWGFSDGNGCPLSVKSSLYDHVVQRVAGVWVWLCIKSSLAFQRGGDIC